MPKLTRVAPELPAAELAASIRYYEDMLGFRIAAEFPDGRYAVLERDDVAIHLFEDRSGRPSPVSIHLFTEGLDELESEFLDRGVRLSQKLMVKPWGTRDLRLTDPFGNELKFTEPI